MQGVGFRPFIYRLATDLRLTGWVCNTPQGVSIEAEGKEEVLRDFLLKIEPDKPANSSIYSLEYSLLDPAGYDDFQIRESGSSGDAQAVILPDIATCPECLAELFDPSNRRYLYPFTNCTHCGPRYSIMESLPYDRARTTMRTFGMCPQCQAEYDNPSDRRFHAQPNACPQCGPHVELWDLRGRHMESHHAALLETAQAIREGRIVAVKGLGGFHLIADARNDQAIRRLRERKSREEKPLAVMCPSVDAATEICHADELEQRLLRSPQSPIVFLRRRSKDGGVSGFVAPRNPYLGVMLPYTPLHHLLMRELGFTVVATSGNVSDEPICTDEEEAIERLAHIADFFLVHNRPIRRHMDDSIARILLGREFLLRRARGYAPLPIRVGVPVPPAGVLAVGAHLKNTVALGMNRSVVVSQHLGDLETAASVRTFRDTVEDIQRLHTTHAETIVCDLHPDYHSTRYALETGCRVVHVQHHLAHVLSCMTENGLDEPVLGVSWDGTGLGTDHTIWGGEFLVPDDDGFKRVGCLRPFRLPGGDAAVREPRRSAAGVLYELYGEAAFDEPLLAVNFSEPERRALAQMLGRHVHCPITTSAGRLFDAMASLIGLVQATRFEGHAAMSLEFVLDPACRESYPVTLTETEDGAVIDWAVMVEGVLSDTASGLVPARVSAKFHNTLVDSIAAMARRTSIPAVVLTGGCFQNAFLLERTVLRLRADGFRPYWHQRVPTNDGGLALGQIVAACRQEKAMKGEAYVSGRAG